MVETLFFITADYKGPLLLWSTIILIVAFMGARADALVLVCQ